jgi:hypothetical protein
MLRFFRAIVEAVRFSRALQKESGLVDDAALPRVESLEVWQERIERHKASAEIDAVAPRKRAGMDGCTHGA